LAYYTVTAAPTLDTTWLTCPGTRPWYSPPGGLTQQDASIRHVLTRRLEPHKGGCHGAVATLIGLGWQAAQWVDPTLTGPDFKPSVVWGPGLLLRFHASFLAWRQEHDRAERLQLESGDRSRPNILFHRAEHAEISFTPAAAVHLRAPRAPEHLEVWEVWFRNRPEHPDHRSQAQEMTASVELCDDQWRAGLRFVGQWVESIEPEHVGWTALRDRWSLPPTHTWGKLLILGNDSAVISNGEWSDKPDENGELEWIEKSRRIVLALSGECIHAMASTTPPLKYWLDDSVTRLRVTLIALNMPERVYQFALKRDLEGAVTDISQI
jgi:hypothetical protein